MKGLKKLLGLTLAAMMSISLVGCSSSDDKEASGDKLQQIKDAGVLVVGTSADYAPYEFKKGEEIVGFDDSMVQEIAKDIGVEVKYEDITSNYNTTGIEVEYRFYFRDGTIAKLTIFKRIVATGDVDRINEDKSMYYVFFDNYIYLIYKKQANIKNNSNESAKI